ncbi:hypothetical protein BS47DRAFT_1354016, partial [Hydnum rufescens UP504]
MWSLCLVVSYLIWKHEATWHNFYPIVSIPPSRMARRTIQHHAPKKSSLRESLGITLGLPSEVLASQSSLTSIQVGSGDSYFAYI